MIPNNAVTEPLIFQPIFKEKIWGGQNLKTTLLKDIPEGLSVGESWELSGYGSDLSKTTAANGINIRQLLEKNPKGILGDITPTTFFPLLYKFIDAQDNLSVQVHPDDKQAVDNNWGNFGKTECWYIVGAKRSAHIIIGFKEGVNLSDIKNSIKQNTLDTLLNYIPIAKGDVLFVPACTVHAILEGTLLYEVQESSDTTFRLYDWGRVDKSGNSRELHVEKALNVLDTSYHNKHKVPPVFMENTNGVDHFFRVACKYFALEEYFFKKHTNITLPNKKSFIVITVLENNLFIKDTKVSHFISKGQTVLLPANYYNENISIEGEKNSRFILSSVPDLKKEVVIPLRNREISDDTIASLGGNPARNDILRIL